MYKPGDKVRIKSLEDIQALCPDLEDGELKHYSGVVFASSMERLCGQEVTIKEVMIGDWGRYYNMEESVYSWYNWMFEEPAFDKTVHCIPQDVFEYPEDKLYMSQLLSSKVSKLLMKISMVRAKLDNLEKQYNAYREMQSKL